MQMLPLPVWGMPMAGTKIAFANSEVYSIPFETGDAVVRTSISLVMPMYNESACVDRTLATAVRSLARNFTNFEIIVVDDGSTDDCAARVQRWMEADRRITLVRMSSNQRFGGALSAGLAAATKDLVFYTDFDLPVDLDFFPEVAKGLRSDCVLTGYSPDYPKNLSWSSRLLSSSYNGLVQLLFQLRLRDVNFGFKAMRRSVAEQMRLVSKSPFVDAEIFIQARRAGHRVREIAVPFSTRKAGVSRIRRFDVVAWTLLDMARVWLFSPRPMLPRAAKKAESAHAPQVDAPTTRG
jgi:glycosyltransferase involved in cell wall biosynthesis